MAEKASMRTPEAEELPQEIRGLHHPRKSEHKKQRLTTILTVLPRKTGVCFAESLRLQLQTAIENYPFRGQPERKFRCPVSTILAGHFYCLTA
jgi:hypothetical protein